MNAGAQSTTLLPKRGYSGGVAMKVLPRILLPTNPQNCPGKGSE